MRNISKMNTCLKTIRKPKTPGQSAESFPVKCLSSSRVFLALCLCLSSSSSLAAPNAGVSVNNPTTVSFDRNNTFGWRFTPVTDIDVTALGYSDASSLPGGTGAGLSQPHEVGIYRVSDQALIADATVPAGTGGTLGGNFRYVQLPSPARLTGGTTYLMAGFGLSVTPDPAVATAQWTMAAGILYANAPTPTLANPTTGTSQYLVSAHGSPPAMLTYPALEQTAILPVFAANFQFTAPAPQLTADHPRALGRPAPTPAGGLAPSRRAVVRAR